MKNWRLEIIALYPNFDVSESIGFPFGFFGTEIFCKRKKSEFYPKNVLFCFQLGKKWFSILMRICSGIFWHSECHKNLPLRSFCIFKNLYSFEPCAVRAPSWGCSPARRTGCSLQKPSNNKPGLAYIGASPKTQTHFLYFAHFCG